MPVRWYVLAFQKSASWAVTPSGVILIRTAEDENVVGLQRVAEPVDEEDLDTIDGSAAEGDDEIAPEVDVDDEPEEE